MKEIRCPYCIEVGGFRKVMRRDDSLVCNTCSLEALDRLGFRCRHWWICSDVSRHPCYRCRYHSAYWLKLRTTYSQPSQFVAVITIQLGTSNTAAPLAFGLTQRSQDRSLITLWQTPGKQ